MEERIFATIVRVESGSGKCNFYIRPEGNKGSVIMVSVRNESTPAGVWLRSLISLEMNRSLG